MFIQAPAWLYPKDIRSLINYKNPTHILTSFREFVDKNPNYFPDTAYIDRGNGTVYHPLYILFFYENMELLEAGTRTLKYTSEAEEKLKKKYRAFILGNAEENPILDEIKRLEERIDVLENREFKVVIEDKF